MTFKSLLVASLALLLTAGARAEDAGTCPQEEVCAIPCPADNPTPGIGEYSHGLQLIVKNTIDLRCCAIMHSSREIGSSAKVFLTA